MKIVYVLADRADGPYTAMTTISALSARRVDSDAHIELLIPAELGEELKGSRLFDLCNEVVMTRCPFPENRERSRYLKTVMRQHISGDFAFLDSDTLVLRRFDDDFAKTRDIASAEDLNRGKPTPGFPHEFIALYDKMGWRTTFRYYNSGVIFMRDNRRVHAACHKWHAAWVAALNEVGCVFDQPAFNHSLDIEDVTVDLLPRSLNALVDANPRFARGASILHFFTTGGHPRGETIAAQLLGIFEETGTIPWELLDQCRKDGHPWSQPCPPWKLAACGSILAAFREKARSALGFGPSLSDLARKF